MILYDNDILWYNDDSNDNDNDNDIMMIIMI